MKENNKENPFNKFGEGTEESLTIQEINKSDIFNAMREPVMEGTLSIQKTGKEIKDQINSVIMPKLTANYQETINKLDNLLTLTGNPPTFPIRYYKIKLDLPYKEYDWCETHFCEEKEEVVEEGEVFENFADDENYEIAEDESVVAEDVFFKKNPPLSAEQAQARCSYNETLRILMEIAVDIKTAQVLLQLEDGKTFKLNVNQSIALGF